jgi:hypothetical protein
MSTGSAQRDLAWGVEADGMGNVLVAAQFSQTIDFFGTSFTALGSEDALIAKLDGDGAVVWASRPSGFQRDIPLCIHRQAEAPHALYFGGYYWGVITYGSTTLDDVGNGDAMLVAGLDTTFAVSAYAAPVCPGACDGVAYAFVNGDGPFTYAWSTGATTSWVAGLCTGGYVVEVTDANGHVRSDTLVVGEHDPLQLGIQVDGDSLWVEGGSDWVWELDGSQVNAGQPYHIAWASGTYQVHYLDEHGCLNATPTVLVVLNVGVAGPGTGPLSLFPVPAGDRLFVRASGPLVRAEAIDATGRMAQLPVLATGTLDTRSLASGVWALRVTLADGRTLSGRFVRE